MGTNQRDLGRQTFTDAFLRYFVLKWMGEHNDLQTYNGKGLFGSETMDVELRRMYESGLFHLYFSDWMSHECNGHENCSAFFVMDGQLKNSHAICACEVGSADGPHSYGCEETGPISIGCRNPPRWKGRLCVDCFQKVRLVERSDDEDSKEEEEEEEEEAVAEPEEEVSVQDGKNDDLVDSAGRAELRTSVRKRRVPEHLSQDYNIDTAPLVFEKILDYRTHAVKSGKETAILGLLMDEMNL